MIWSIELSLIIIIITFCIILILCVYIYGKIFSICKFLIFDSLSLIIHHSAGLNSIFYNLFFMIISFLLWIVYFITIRLKIHTRLKIYIANLLKINTHSINLFLISKNLLIMIYLRSQFCLIKCGWKLIFLFRVFLRKYLMWGL